MVLEVVEGRGHCNCHWHGGYQHGRLATVNDEVDFASGDISLPGFLDTLDGAGSCRWCRALARRYSSGVADWVVVSTGRWPWRQIVTLTQSQGHDFGGK